VLLVLVLPGGTAAQRPGRPCPGDICAPAPSSDPATAARVYQRKLEFVTAVRQFAIALTGTFGDEGRRLIADIDAMDAALARWDESVAGFEQDLARHGDDPDAHVALGAAYLDRSRVDDAVREFRFAVRLAPSRVDIYQLIALAHGLANRDSALEAWLMAAALQADDPVPQYEVARLQVERGREAEVLAAWRAFRATAEKQLAANEGRSERATPFGRAGLLRQPAGVAPIFAPSAYVQAIQLLMKGAFSDAIRESRHAAAGDPLIGSSGTAPDLVAEGSAALRRGDLSAALKSLRAAAGASPVSSEAHRVLAMAFRLDEQFEQSIEQYNAAIRALPTDERSRIGLADVLLTLERFGEAEQVLRETIRVIPRTVQAHYKLGRLYQSTARNADALGELEQAAQFSPLIGQDALYEMIGEIYVTQSDFPHAAAAFKKQLLVNPNNADAHRLLADVLVRQDRAEEALAEFSASLLIDPRIVNSRVGVGQIHFQAGRYAEAAVAARAALDLDPGRKEAHYVLAMSLLRLGQTESGDSELREFQRLQADAASATRRKYEVDALRREATLSLTRADYSAAIPRLRQLIGLEPGVAANYIELGDALLKTNLAGEAIDSFQRALQLEYSNLDLHRQLAQAYLTVGQPDNSRKEADLYRALIEAAKKERLRRLGAP
jgi:tetratricopeptide (TPR) repeat protein